MKVTARLRIQPSQPLRVDTVHQGQHDGQPGVYHINAVDTVTQWQVVGCTETISEQHLIPVLEAILHQRIPALESNCDFRLISHWNQFSISGSFLDWKMLSAINYISPRWAGIVRPNE